jgi:hypothetical protein
LWGLVSGPCFCGAVFGVWTPSTSVQYPAPPRRFERFLSDAVTGRCHVITSPPHPCCSPVSPFTSSLGVVHASYVPLLPPPRHIAFTTAPSPSSTSIRRLQCPFVNQFIMKTRTGTATPLASPPRTVLHHLLNPDMIYVFGLRRAMTAMAGISKSSTMDQCSAVRGACGYVIRPRTRRTLWMPRPCRRVGPDPVGI